MISPALRRLMDERQAHFREQARLGRLAKKARAARPRIVDTKTEVRDGVAYRVDVLEPFGRHGLGRVP